MNRYRCMRPDGTYIYTAAPTLRKARMNVEWRLRRLGMFYLDAREWASGTEACRDAETQTHAAANPSLRSVELR